MTKRPRPVAIYARLSVTTEESVSIERQLQAARDYASARGWEVVVEAVDDGVSATKNKPEDRKGWRALLDAPETFEVVIVWKVDRLARRVLDFLHADEMLQTRDASLVAVEDPIDMTTDQGRAFATMLAVFGEMEAKAIGAPVRAARAALVKGGRRVGGRPPFGFQNIPNPAGPGYVLGHDPERIDIVRALVERAQEGASLYGLVRWLEAKGIEPRKRSGRKSARWHEASVEAILRNPVLAGMTMFTPGRQEGDERFEVLRDEDGIPVVDESIAILTPPEHRSLIASLDAGKKPGSRPKAGAEPSLLYGLAVCSGCGGPLHRAVSGGKYRQLRCADRSCPAPVTVNRDKIETYVEDEFLQALGSFSVVIAEVQDDEGSEALADIEAAISETVERMKADDADVAALAERLGALKAARTKARAEASAEPSVSFHRTGETFGEAWDRTDDVEERRQLLLSGLEAVVVLPGPGRGKPFSGDRVDLVFHRSAEETAAPSGPDSPPG